MLGMQLNSIVYWLIWSTKIIPVESKMNLHCLGLGWSQLAVLQDGMQRMNHRSRVIMEVNPRHSNCWKGWQEDAFVNGASFEDSNRTVELFNLQLMMRKLAWFIDLLPHLMLSLLLLTTSFFSILLTRSAVQIWESVKKVMGTTDKVIAHPEREEDYSEERCWTYSFTESAPSCPRFAFLFDSFAFQWQRNTSEVIGDLPKVAHKWFDGRMGKRTKRWRIDASINFSFRLGRANMYCSWAYGEHPLCDESSLTCFDRTVTEYFPLVVDGSFNETRMELGKTSSKLWQHFPPYKVLIFNFFSHIYYSHIIIHIAKLCFKLCKPRIRGRCFRWVSLFHLQRSTKRQRFRVPVSQQTCDASL